MSLSTVSTIAGYKSHYTQDSKRTLCGREVSNATSGIDMCKACEKSAAKITAAETPAAPVEPTTCAHRYATATGSVAQCGATPAAGQTLCTYHGGEAAPVADLSDLFTPEETAEMDRRAVVRAEWEEFRAQRDADALALLSYDADGRLSDIPVRVIFRDGGAKVYRTTGTRHAGNLIRKINDAGRMRAAHVIMPLGDGVNVIMFLTEDVPSDKWSALFDRDNRHYDLSARPVFREVEPTPDATDATPAPFEPYEAHARWAVGPVATREERAAQVAQIKADAAAGTLSTNPAEWGWSEAELAKIKSDAEAAVASLVRAPAPVPAHARTTAVKSAAEAPAEDEYGPEFHAAMERLETAAETPARPVLTLTPSEDGRHVTVAHGGREFRCLANRTAPMHVAYWARTAVGLRPADGRKFKWVAAGEGSKIMTAAAARC